jgi:putative ABC transport system permease protein
MNLGGPFWADLRFAARTLLRHPGYTIVATATLTIGIAANAVIFSVTRPILLTPLPYQDPRGLVRILGVKNDAGIDSAGLATGDFLDYRRLSKTVQDISAYVVPHSFVLTGGDTPESVLGSELSPSAFQMLGAKAELGRVLAAAEETAGRDKVVVLSHGFWRRRFASDPGIVNRTLKLDDVQYLVVGVMPESFQFPREGMDLWVPLAFGPADLDRDSHTLQSLGRLRPGFTADQADADLKRVADQLAQSFPDSNKGWTVRATPYAKHLAKRVRPALLVLSGAVGLLLLIACSNLANLLLARGASRSRETAIRAAVGAQAGSLVRLFLVESLLISLLGGVLALPLAMAGVDLLQQNTSVFLPRLSEISVNGAVILFSLVLSVVSAMLFGLVPAFQLSRPDLNTSSKDGSGAGGRRGAIFRALLVVSEVALALILLTSAALLFRGFLKLTLVDPGFEARSALTLQVGLSQNRYPSAADRVGFFDRLLGELAQLPGVQSVAAASTLPLADQGQRGQPFEIDGTKDPEATKGIEASLVAVTPAYFQTLGIPLRKGRVLKAQDTDQAPPVVVISDQLARRFFAGRDAVGQRLKLHLVDSGPAVYEIVGVVGDVRQRALSEGPDLVIYAPLAQVTYPDAFLVLRTKGDPLSVAEAAQKRVFALDPNQPVSRTFALGDLLERAGAQSRFYTTLLGVFAGIGLLLACIGLYGVIAYNVTRRKHEFALRMAVGASTKDILWLVVGGGLRMTLLGIVIGLTGAFALTGLLKSLLFGLGPRDPSTFTLAPALLLAVALLACYLPARRAMRVDPVSPLRQI